MTTRSQILRHFYGGGWATDFGPTTDVSPDNANKVLIPYLVNAENLFYELDGGPHKVGGTEQLNATVINSGATIRGLYDYWRQGTGGAPARRRVLHSGTSIYADGDDQVYATIFTGLEDLVIPSYATFDDFLIIASDSNTDVPKSWDQTTAQNLAGTPPNFAFSTTHHNRQWAAGVAANPSTLYHSAAEDPEDWVGAGSGTILINPNDGDHITGIYSYKNDLWVFKGPYKGSIHRITGTSPSDFARTQFITGLGAAWHNSIFTFGDDLGFISQFGTVHSLNATAAFGDFREAALSRPIHNWLRDHLNFTRLKNIWAINDPGNGYVLFTVSKDASTTNNTILMMDYRFNPVRWAEWPAYASGSLNIFQDTSELDRIYSGGNDGFVKRTNVLDRSIDGATAISMKATTPYMNYGNPMMMKTISQASVGISAKGDYDATFAWSRDDNTQQTEAFDQRGSADVLGAASANEFTLGTSKLAGASFIDRFMELEEGGEGRAFQYELVQNVISQDLEVHSFSTTLSGGALSTEN